MFSEKMMSHSFLKSDCCKLHLETGGGVCCRHGDGGDLSARLMLLF